MDQWVKRTQRDYTMAFKLAVVDQVEKGELTYIQAQERYGIQGASTVLMWLRKHGRQDWKAASSDRGRPSMSEPPKPLTPEQRIKELEVQLKEAQEKAAFFEAVVGVLKRDYGVKVAKKPAGKSSKKSSSKG
jgi:transposase